MEPLLKENAQLRKQLNDCTSRLMQLSGSTHQITDADIQQNFQDLHSMIESALNTFLELHGHFDGWDKLFKDRLDEAVCNLAGISRDLFSDLLQATPGSLESSPDGFAWLSKQECCDCLVTSRMVWRFLKQHVFDRRHLPSGLGLPNVDEITSKDSGLIQDIFQLLVRGSRDVAPPSHTPSWKPEALKAIRELTGFRHRQEKLVETLASALCDELRKCISSENPNELNDFCHACVQLALEMVTNMACSSQTYEVSDGPTLQTRLPSSKLGEWKLLSISSWRAPHGAVDWKPVIALAPGLYNGTQLDDGSLGVALVKPLWVVFEEESAKNILYGTVVDDDQSFSLEPGTSTTVESASDTTQGKPDVVGRGPSHKDLPKGGSSSRHKDVGPTPPASPQGYSKTSRTSEGRGKVDKDQRWERKKGHRSRRHGPADHLPSREGSRSSAAESESSGLDSITNTTKSFEPQELRTRAYASDSDAHHPVTLDTPRRAATEPDARRSPTADRMIGAKASKESTGGGRGDVKRHDKHQYYNKERVRTTSYGPMVSYSLLPRRLPILWPPGHSTR